jgi:hypothetical protein
MPDNDNEAEGLTILGALAQLKDDIRRLQEKDEELGRAPMFMIQEGELELKLTVVKDIKAEAKGMAKFKLILAGEVSVGASGGISRESLQTLKIKFRALLPQEAEKYTSENQQTPSDFKITMPILTLGKGRERLPVVLKQGSIREGRTKKRGGTAFIKRR